MKKMLLVMTLFLSLMSCDRHDNKKTNPSTGYERDNTGKNVRDRDSMAKTSFDQNENEVDRTITQKIRQKIMDDDSLSTNAKNIKIITIKRVVTLRGPVANLQEKNAIAKKLNDIEGIEKVENQLEVSQNNH